MLHAAPPGSSSLVFVLEENLRRLGKDAMACHSPGLTSTNSTDITRAGILAPNQRLSSC